MVCRKMEFQLNTKLYQNIIKPLLFCLPPETAHKYAMEVLKYRYKFIDTPKPDTIVKGLPVANKVGIAAGFDKDGEYIDTLAKLGFGYIEVGTVTPLPQPGNKKPRLHRFADSESLVNSMGFNNSGVDVLIKNIRASRYTGTLGVNVGKNFNTPLHKAVDDYITCIERVYEYASYIVVNISSPNTKDLRELQNGKYFRPLIDDLKTLMLSLDEEHNRHVPLFIKISPDEELDVVQGIIEVLCEFDVEGIIIANTTISKDVKNSIGAKGIAGGVSGSPLKESSRKSLRLAKQLSGDKLCVISVGGIDSAEEAQYRLSLGADLIQLYTGLIYKGPQLLKDILANKESSGLTGVEKIASLELSV